MTVSVDKLGTIASAICAVHCVLTGVALGLLSVVGLGFMASGTTEAVFIFTAIGLGSLAVFHGRKKHHSYIPSLFFVLGMVFIVLSHFAFHHSHDSHHASSMGATITSVLGGCSLVVFHILNLRMASKCGCSHCATGH